MSNYPIPHGYVVVPGCGAGERSAALSGVARRNAKREAGRAADEIRAAHIRDMDRKDWIARARARQEAADAEVANLEAQLASIEKRASTDPRLMKLAAPVQANLDTAKRIAARTAEMVAAEIATLEAAK